MENFDFRKNQWIINRIGMLNFWCYDEEEFYFEDGRLLLRGTNGSGKSVTMQSFIPLLLDGNKSPDRLDPFGSKARRLENYLLGDDDNPREENTGYLFMEFKKSQTQNFITIGMGLRARRNKPLEFWGFSIKDGRRIGQDFQLYKNLGNKVPLSKQEMKNRIGDGGEVHDSTKDYMTMVNKLLFGFENIEDYDELIKLLIQIRTPKLSREFKPTVIYEILYNSLQPLSDDDLRPMSEAIENMDNIKSQLEVLTISKKAGNKILNEFDKYNKFVLYEKSRDFVKSSRELNDLIKENEEEIQKQIQFIKLFEENQNEHQNLKMKRDSLEHKKSSLEKHDAFKAKLEIEKLKDEINKHKASQVEKENVYDEKRSREKRIDKEIKVCEDTLSSVSKDFYSYQEDMEEIADETKFYEHTISMEEMGNSLGKEYDFSLLKHEVQRHREKITSTKKALEQEKIAHMDYDKASLELDNAKRKKEDDEKNNERAQQLLSENKEEYTEKLYNWSQNNVELNIDRSEMINLIRTVNLFGDSTTFDDIRQETRIFYDGYKEKINQGINKFEISLLDKNKELQKTQKELNEWKSKKDPEPLREDKVISSRRKLKEKNIPFLPLYKVVDFADHLDEHTKNQIEEALYDMGLLDALIVPPGREKEAMDIIKGSSDKFIMPALISSGDSLIKYLKTETLNESFGINKSFVESVLKSISIDNPKSSTGISDTGEYRIGLIEGRTSSTYVSNFIGAQSRERFRAQNIQRLENEIHLLEKDIKEIEGYISNEKARINTLNTEFTALPDKRDLETALSILNKTILELELSTKDFANKEKVLESKYKVYKEIKDVARELTRKLGLGNELSTHVEAENSFLQYQKKLSEVEITFIKYAEKIRFLNNLKENMEDLRVDLDNVLYDLSTIKHALAELNGKASNLLEILQNQNFDEIIKEIEICVEGLRSLPDAIERALIKAQEYKAKNEGSIKELENLKRKISKKQELLSIYKEIFEKEEDLGYLGYSDVEADSNLHNEDSKKRAQYILSQLKAFEKETKTREEMSGILQQKYHENREHFIDYNLHITTLFEDYSQTNMEDEKSQIIKASKRFDISAKIQGKQVNFFHLVKFIEESLEINEKLLKDGDRQLFEDILANTIGKKIKSKIFHSEKWVKEMNALMESMNTSSGLSFSLNWKNKSAETEEQLSTRELVDILKSDSALLSIEQMETLAKHFRSKIAEARKLLELAGTTQSFHAIIKEVLDYRTWFEFELYYKKTGENKKELTNNAFFRFSGGEKAMAMYVPLFSAVFAKYQGARYDSPRIISLDEAFAGVDENNIRDMFRLLEELNLSFIINSQNLWGDYDTVPALSICELIRPNNADFVTVIRYKWNGKKKELLL